MMDNCKRDLQYILAVVLIAFCNVAMATNLSAVMTVDNTFSAYISTDDNVQGTLIGSGANWPNQDQFAIALAPGVTNYLHIIATDLGPPAMFIGDFSLDDNLFIFPDGGQNISTQSAWWQASQTGFGSGYLIPSDLGQNGQSPWGTFNLIDPVTRFIWYPETNTGTVYFSLEITPTFVPPPSTYSVGGSASGLTGAGLALQNNGTEILSIAADGLFTFLTELVDTTAYTVIVSTQPTGQTCTVTNGSGAIAAADVSNVSVACADDVVPAVPMVPIPTLSQWSLVLLTMLLGLMVFVNRRRLF